MQYQWTDRETGPYEHSREPLQKGAPVRRVVRRKQVRRSARGASWWRRDAGGCIHSGKRSTIKDEMTGTQRGPGPQPRRSFPHFLRKKWGRRRQPNEKILPTVTQTGSRSFTVGNLFYVVMPPAGYFRLRESTQSAPGLRPRTPLSARHFVFDGRALS